MRVRPLLLSLVPPPRRPVTWLRALPLVLFLAAFGAVCLGLEGWRVVTFARPAAFALVAFAPWVWWLHVAGHGGLRGARGQVALAVRFVLLAALIAVLAEPQAVRLHHSLAVVYAVDLSDSVGDAAAEGALSRRTLTPNEAGRHGLALNPDGRRRTAFELLGRPEVSFARLAAIWPELAAVPPRVRETLTVEARYAGYLDRQRVDIRAFRADESLHLPADLDFAALSGLSNEVRERLAQARPASLGAAARLPGMTPAALTLLYRYARKAA